MNLIYTDTLSKKRLLDDCINLEQEEPSLKKIKVEERLQDMYALLANSSTEHEFFTDHHFTLPALNECKLASTWFYKFASTRHPKNKAELEDFFKLTSLLPEILKESYIGNNFNNYKHDAAELSFQLKRAQEKVGKINNFVKSSFDSHLEEIASNYHVSDESLILQMQERISNCNLLVTQVQLSSLKLIREMQLLLNKIKTEDFNILLALPSDIWIHVYTQLGKIPTNPSFIFSHLFTNNLKFRVDTIKNIANTHICWQLIKNTQAGTKSYLSAIKNTFAECGIGARKNISLIEKYNLNFFAIDFAKYEGTALLNNLNYVAKQITNIDEFIIQTLHLNSPEKFNLSCLALNLIAMRWPHLRKLTLVKPVDKPMLFSFNPISLENRFIKQQQDNFMSLQDIKGLANLQEIEIDGLTVDDEILLKMTTCRPLISKIKLVDCQQPSLKLIASTPHIAWQFENCLPANLHDEVI